MFGTNDTVNIDVLPRWQRWLILRFFKKSYEELGIPQGKLVRTVALGGLSLVLSLTIGWVLKLFMLLVVVVLNMRNLNPRGGLNPFNWNDDDGWPLESGRTQSSRWIKDKFGDYYHPVLKWYNLLIAVVVFLIVWGCTSGDLLRWTFLDVVTYVGPWLVGGLVVAYTIAGVSVLRKRHNSLKARQRRLRKSWQR